MDEEDLERLFELMDKYESEGLSPEEQEEFEELASEYDNAFGG